MRFLKLFGSYCLLLVMAMAGTAHAQQPVLDKDYKLITPPQKTDSGKKVEVVEFFSYACPHCADFQPALDDWLKRKPKDADFRMVPMVFKESWKAPAKLFYTLEAMGALEKMHRKVYDAIHKENQQLFTDQAVIDWAAKQGLDKAKFEQIYNSFGIDTKVQRSVTMGRAYGVQFTPAIAHCGDAAQQARWLEGVAAGSITGALALGADTVTAEATDGGWRLNGSVRHVVDGDRADEIAVVATVMDENGDGAPAVFVVERTIAGLTAERTPTFDYVAHIADVTLHDVVVAADRRLAAVDVAGGVERTVAEATLGWAIPTVGACQRILDMTVAYVKERHQFGVPIGSFQAVKHKAVDMYVAVERARAVCQYAALVLAEGDPAWRTAVSMAKAAAGDCQRLLVRDGLQLHGGVGFTWEHDLHFALKRAKAGDLLFGSAAFHRARLADLLGLAA